MIKAYFCMCQSDCLMLSKLYSLLNFLFTLYLIRYKQLCFLVKLLYHCVRDFCNEHHRKFAGQTAGAHVPTRLWQVVLLESVVRQGVTKHYGLWLEGCPQRRLWLARLFYFHWDHLFNPFFYFSLDFCPFKFYLLLLVHWPLHFFSLLGCLA